MRCRGGAATPRLLREVLRAVALIRKRTSRADECSMGPIEIMFFFRADERLHQTGAVNPRAF